LENQWTSIIAVNEALISYSFWVDIIKNQAQSVIIWFAVLQC
jgi:hypothetical protein